jgi:hypothetical protein
MGHEVQTWMAKKGKFLILPGTDLQSSNTQPRYSLKYPTSFYLSVPLKLSITLGFKLQLLPRKEEF